jgi:hypothetical protein
MKDIINFITESVSDITYALRWYYYADEKMSWSYQSSLNRAQKFIQKMQKQGMKIYEIYEIPSDNVKEFKAITKKKGDIEDQLKEICNGHWNRTDIEKFLDKK